jgi:hypothetical protein
MSSEWSTLEPELVGARRTSNWPPVDERLWARVDRTEACWTWMGNVSNGGYGQINNGGRLVMVHRLAYELLVGPIPLGLQLDHLCRNRRCVNPAHLEPVTQQENIRRGNSGQKNAARTHCPDGHPYDESNTYLSPGSKSRTCRTCQQAARRRWKQRNVS